MEHYYSGQIRSDFMVIRPGADGGVKVQNSSGDPVNIAVDIEGWYSNVVAAGTTTHPSSWPVSTNTGGTFDPYTWDMAATVGATDQLVQVQACYGTSSTDTAPDDLA